MEYDELGMKRPTWDEYYLSMALTASFRAACHRRQVGAVVVNSENRLVGAGYNGTPAGQTHCTDGGCPRGLMSYEECPSLGSYSNCTGRHAEHNAIENAEGGLYGGTIYITREPCENCQTRISVAGLDRAVWPDGEFFFTGN